MIMSSKFPELRYWIFIKKIRILFNSPHEEPIDFPVKNSNPFLNVFKLAQKINS